MQDNTENIRRDLVQNINAQVAEDTTEAAERKRLETEHGIGNVWDTSELTKKFEVQSFLAPFCLVIGRESGQKGTVMFQHYPRFYFDWKPDGN